MYLFSVIELIDRYCPLLLFPKSKYFSANFKNTNKYIPARTQNRILSPSVNAEFPSKITRTKSRISGMTLTLKTLFSMSNLDASSQNISSSCSIIVAGFLKYVHPPRSSSDIPSYNLQTYGCTRLAAFPRILLLRQQNLILLSLLPLHRIAIQSTNSLQFQIQNLSAKIRNPVNFSLFLFFYKLN